MSKPLAIVTGATGGLGKPICELLLKKEIDVIGISRSLDNTSLWKNYACDLSKPEEIISVLEEIYKSTEKAPDILINNAGLYHAKSWQQISGQDFSSAMYVNVIAPFMLTQFWAKELIAQNKSGVCVNISSISGLSGSMDPSYSSSKAAMIMLTKNMGKDLAQHGIRVNAIAPGPIKTAMADKIPKDRQEDYKNKIPMRRFAETEEVVSLVNLLISSDSSYMTGSVITADGGLLS